MRLTEWQRLLGFLVIQGVHEAIANSLLRKLSWLCLHFPVFCSELNSKAGRRGINK
jgi:hypothetical protein